MAKFELKPKPYHRNISEDELMADLKRVASRLKKQSVTTKEYDKYGKFSSETLIRRLGWSNALRKVGLNTNRNYGLTETELIADLKRVAVELKKQSVTTREYDQHGKFHNTTLKQRLGGWPNALKKAGLDITYYDYGLTETGLLEPLKRNVPDEKFIADFKRVASELNKSTLTTTEYEKHGKFAVKTIYARFGSWAKILEKAGLKKSRNFGITEEECFKNLENVWMKLGRQPHCSDMCRPLSEYSQDIYENRFGSWRKALEKFIKYVNQKEIPAVATTLSIIDKTEPSQEEITSVFAATPVIKKDKHPLKQINRHKTSRTVNWRLRFLVMRRDEFTCKNCGWSPATGKGRTLEVDHDTPWTKGGETVFDNLKTLCNVCNTGKSNL